jgi:hypothetical protein
MAWTIKAKAEAKAALTPKNAGVDCTKNSKGPTPPAVEGMVLPRFEITVISTCC